MPRGRRYSRLRGLSERTLTRVYRSDWPARFWARVPPACEVEVVRHQLALLPPGTPPLRVGFLSDLHVGPLTPRPLLDAAAAALDAAELDLLCVGGDLVYLEATETRCADVAEILGQISAPTRLMVWGNHDLWTRHDRLERHLRRVEVRPLVNEAAWLPAPWAGVAVVGLDETHTGAPDAARALAGTGDADLRIGLCHAPEGFTHLRGRVDLCLSGHTHGGQVAMPGGRPLWVPGAFGAAHPGGRYDLDGGVLFVSRGLGLVEVPLRLFARPDVIVLELSAADG